MGFQSAQGARTPEGARPYGRRSHGVKTPKVTARRCARMGRAYSSLALETLWDAEESTDRTLVPWITLIASLQHTKSRGSSLSIMSQLTCGGMSSSPGGSWTSSSSEVWMSCCRSMALARCGSRASKSGNEESSERAAQIARPLEQVNWTSTNQVTTYAYPTLARDSGVHSSRHIYLDAHKMWISDVVPEESYGVASRA